MKLLHTCYEVDRLDAALSTARAAVFAMIRAPAPAVAFEGRCIAWVYRELGLVELLERALAPA